MAFRSSKRKEFKKCSYYVWFLGAKESKGLRGEEFIIPVVQPAIEREKKIEPMKVTLQLSHKGMKIVQTVPKKGSNNPNKTEQVKHFIPHHAITCVHQLDPPDDDVVSTILLIYNPMTKCPVHVHTYRCDSSETATKLSNQLQMLVSRPENQKKFREIENRLAAKGLLPGLRGVHRQTTMNSDGRSTRTDDSSDSGGGHSSDKEPSSPHAIPAHVSSLYDSLAAELRQKLGGKTSVPLLLPPKDYDTVCRKQGRLVDINKRRSQQMNVVGPMAIFPKVEHDPECISDKDRPDGSGKSSGIGSDEALSSAIQEVSSHPDFENKIIDPDTSSDEDDDWADDPESDEPPIVQQPVPRDEVFMQKSWRRTPPSNKNKPLPTYHYAEGYRSRPAPEDPRRKPDDESFKNSDFRGEDRRFVMYPDRDRLKRSEELRPVYLSREEFERLEKQRREDSVRRHEDVQRRKYDYDDDDEDGIRRRSEPKNDARFRYIAQREKSSERPHQYARNKTPARYPDHYRHSQEADDRGRSGFEIRHSNSLHHLNTPRSNSQSRYPEVDKNPTPNRRLVHSSTLERFPSSHDKYHYGNEIPGLVDPRRSSMHSDYNQEKSRSPGYRGSYVEPSYSSRHHAPAPRYSLTTSQQF